MTIDESNIKVPTKRNKSNCSAVEVSAARTKKDSRTGFERLVEVVRDRGIIRSRELAGSQIHRQTLSRACEQGLIEKCGRGVYRLAGLSVDPKSSLAMACKRVPRGVLCLFSALWYHGLLDERPDRVWIAIDRKARLLKVDVSPIQFVRMSREALTKGFLTSQVCGVTIRVFSPMKTVADCFRYRYKIGLGVAIDALEKSVVRGQYNRQRLLRFADICRVKQAVSMCESARKLPAPAESDQEEPAPTPRVWDGETLRREILEIPIRQLARKYGCSDVAIHNHCKKLGIQLPGRGHWAKQSR